MSTILAANTLSPDHQDGEERGRKNGQDWEYKSDRAKENGVDKEVNDKNY